MDLDIGHLNINAISKALKKDSLSLKNRLQSIIHDSEFVIELADEIKLPLIPNERCGLWYVPTSRRKESAYFKSTDGHTNQWTFSMRRLNKHLLPILNQNDGMIIVDSTRKGKLMPDALLKTIPIWCAVLNSILYEGVTIQDSALKALQSNNWLVQFEEIISNNEFNSMVTRIPALVAEVKRLKLFDQVRLIQVLGSTKPLIPVWFYHGKTKQNLQLDKYFIVCCVTASMRSEKTITVRHAVEDEVKATSWSYVQGSGDDHELWATNDICEGELLPTYFWDNLYNSLIIDNDTGYIYDWLGNDELIEKVNDTYRHNNSKATLDELNLDISNVKNDANSTNISLGIIDGDIECSTLHNSYPEINQLIIMSQNKVTNIPEKSAITVFQLNIDSSKKGSKQLREIFPKIVPNLDISKNITILCDNGKDLSAGLTVLLLCKHFDLDWKLVEGQNRVNKDLVKKQLDLLSTVRKINPSRNTLQSVNTYLMN